MFKLTFATLAAAMTVEKAEPSQLDLVEDEGVHVQVANTSEEEASAGGCCQRSEDDSRCAPWEYYKGKCIVLSRKSIGCTRNVWKPNAVYDPESGRCITPLAPVELGLGLVQEGMECGSQVGKAKGGFLGKGLGL